MAKESTDVEAESQQITELVGDLKIRLGALSAIKSDDRVKSIQNQLNSLIERSQGLTSMVQGARNTNLQLREILGQYLDTFKRFTTPMEKLVAELPSVNPFVEDESLKETMNKAKRLFDKVDEMRRQRTDFITQLREALHQDDITGDLLASAVNREQSDLEELFKTRLKKHDYLVGLLRQNLAAQENIESALIDLNAEFAPQAIKLRETRQKRATELEQLVASGKAYADVVQKCQEGLRFYEELTRRLTELQKEVEQVAERLALEESRSVVEPIPPRAISSTSSTMPGWWLIHFRHGRVCVSYIINSSFILLRELFPESRQMSHNT
ncbi:unnamed protein product [Echinostoma caproni]|uniref:ALIX V-shaped domain-containing protein n=1 Tax=Echinostoma caproni TaxID=27848 RepID=A0A3P8L0X2_9TREM|nr:unnamed protein product [Echinostoma caproni]